MPTIAYLLQAIARIRKKQKLPPPWRRQDLAETTRQVIELAARHIDYGQLELRLVAEAQIDLPSLQRAVGIFKTVDTGRMKTLPLAEKPSTYIERLDKLLDNLAAPHLLEQLEVGLSLQIAADPYFSALLAATVEDARVGPQFTELLKPKIALLTDDQVREAWANISRESDPDRRYRLPRTPIVSDDFFQIASIAEAREKIVRYLSIIRPQLEAYALQQGQTQFPLEALGIARALSWTEAAASSPPTEDERQALRSLTRIAVCCTKIGIPIEEIATAARLPADGVCLKGRAFAEEARRVSQDLPESAAETVLLHQLEDLARLCDELSASPLPVESALKAFKLGLEVAAPDITVEFKAKNEIRLQRVLCRFLVERGLRAFGTKFGWAEADLQVEDVFGALVIEAKIARTPPAPTHFTSWISQLLSYMDQAPLKHKGALIIFNFSNVPLTAPVRFLHTRLLILPINLCAVSPSRRAESIDVVESGERDEFVRVRRVSATHSRAGAVTAKPRNRPRKTSRSRNR